MSSEMNAQGKFEIVDGGSTLEVSEGGYGHVRLLYQTFYKI